MNLYVRDRINQLRESADPIDHDRATTLEMLCVLEEGQASIKDEVSQVKTQTTLTNGRVTKLEALAEKTNGRVEGLEKPAGEIRVIVKAVGKAASIAVLIVGLATGVMALTSKSQPNKDEIKVIVQDAMAQQPKKTP